MRVLCWNSIVNPRYILLSGFWFEDNVASTWINIYGFCNLNDQFRLWEELYELKKSWPQPWIVGGDFNARGHFSPDFGEDRVYNNKQEVVSLFVENLPETLHWKGLWFSFARHGDVVNAYITRKRNRGGKRFGFVRMKNLKEAERVIQRLHGFTLYGLKLSVKRARNNYGWKRIVAGRTQVTNNWTMESGDGLSKGHDEGGAATESMLANNVKLDPKENVGGDVNGQKKSCAERINKNINLGFPDARDPIEEDNSEDESGREIFTDLEVSEGKQRKKRVKKYGSLLDIQNKGISEKERIRRDKALKKKIWSMEILEQTELSGKSLSDSDINNRVSKIISEAKEVLKLGKKIGVNFLGEENDIINDLVDIELKD
ncbi:hypothetical protein GQ457_01G010940 [Hibiscus cannabinus]